MKPQQLSETLETMIDKYGLEYILDDIANICNEKSEHVMSSYQDIETANAWASAALRVQNVAAFCSIDGQNQ